jgi:adenylate cyclase
VKGLRGRKIRRVFVVGLLSSIIVTLASYMGYLDFMERSALDFMVWWKETQRPAQIIIVSIDEEAFAYLGERQPLPRKYLASLISLIHNSGARVIGLDVELKTETDKDSDDTLRQAMPDRTVIPFEVVPSSSQGLYSAVPLFIRDMNIRKGFANTYLDRDGLIRKAPLALRDEKGILMPSFALMIFGLFSREMAKDRPLPEDYDGRTIWINYAGPAGSFPTYPSLPLFRMAESGSAPSADNPFRDKIVMIGATFRESRDIFLTPKGLMRGVEVQANIVNTLLTKSEVRPVNRLYGLLIQACLSMAAGILFIAFRPFKAALLSIAGILIFFAPLSYLAYAKGNYWVDFMLPICAVAFASIVNDVLERKKIRDSFSQYVSKEVVESIYKDEASLEGQRKIVTILFSDIRGFTALSEEIELEQLTDILNRYLTMMADTVLKNGGMINKFIGDSVMAIYGAPVWKADHAHAAVKTAHELQKGLEELNRLWKEQGIAPLRIGIGIHTGEVFAGNVGSARRKEYTIIGDAVNLASRIEGLNKELPTTILMSEETFGYVKDIFDAVDRGIMEIRGRHKPVRVYELKGLRHEEGER